MMVEDDVDDGVPVISMSQVRHCGVWVGAVKYHYPIVRENRWAICAGCRGSFGAWPRDGLDYSGRTDLLTAFRVTFFYSAQEMEGRADRRDYGIVYAAGADAAIDAVQARHFREVDDSARAFIRGC